MVIEDSTQPMPARARKVFQGQVFAVWQWEQQLYDGSTAIYERLEREDTVHTVGVLPSSSILLIEDEQPSRKAVLTPAGGQVEREETPEAAAARELLEETGYQAKKIIPWHTYRPSSKADWFVHAFIGRDLIKVADPVPEAGEKIKLVTFTFDEFLRLGHNPKMRDLVIRIILLEALLDPKKKEALKQLLYG